MDDRLIRMAHSLSPIMRVVTTAKTISQTISRAPFGLIAIVMYESQYSAVLQI